MAIYYVQRKYREDKDGRKHLNYNVTIPFNAIIGMGLDGTSKADRAVDVSYDNATNTITITKITR